MVFDMRYVSLLQRANLLVVANIIHRVMPMFNTTAITVMVDRWRSKTESFHLPCDEMTMTVADVVVILGLPIRGCPITGHVESSTWRERVVGFIG
jgi:hypothetical protein